MVGYGESLLKARRAGWDAAYLEYESLKDLLKELEQLYVASNNAADMAHGSPPPPTKQPNQDIYQGGEMEMLLQKPQLYDSIDDADGMEEGSLRNDNSGDGIDFNLEAIAAQASLEKKANEKSEHFLKTLRKEVEKVSLFVLSRQGELADAVGSLRFNAYLDKESLDRKPSNFSSKVNTSMTVRHDSKGNIGQEYGALDILSTERFPENLSESSHSDEGLRDEELWFLLPNITPRTGRDVSNSSLRLREALDTDPRPLFTGKAVLRLSEKYSSQWEEEQTEVLNDSPSPSTWSPLIKRNVKGRTEEKPSMDPYTLIGVELLHLLRFICINAMGIRKILKKYDKTTDKYAHKIESDQSVLTEQLREELKHISLFNSTIKSDPDGPDAHLQSLTNSEAITAITSSLLKASLSATSMDLASIEKFLIHDEEMLRFKCAIDCIDILREYANVINEPFPAFLSRKAMIVTGYNLGGIEGMKQRALEVLLSFDPDTILLMDKLELSEWQQKCWEYTFTSAGNKMRKTTFDFIEDTGGHDIENKLEWGGVNGASFMINLVSTLLYTVNYYIVAPTANSYAIHLGTNGAFGSTLIGASSLAALFAALFYSLWYSKLSFKSALVVSSIAPLVGNLMYAVALSLQSMRIALLGRILVGFGSAEVVNRQLISACVHYNHMTKASVAFVVAGAVGMSVGPLLAAILDGWAGRDFQADFYVPHVGDVIFDHVSSPGFLMALLWFIQLIFVIFMFQEPFRINTSHKFGKKEKKESFCGTLKMVWDLVFSNPALPITLFLFAFIEMICEILISSCAMVSRRYFGWNGDVAGYLIAALGALVIPAHFVVERASRNFDERAIMKSSLIFIIICLFGILNYEIIYFDLTTATKYAEVKSVETWEVVKNVSIEDYHTLQDPLTWERLRNETEKDWHLFENMTDHEFEQLQNQTREEWQKLEQEGEQEWMKLSDEAKQKYADFSNSTKEEWIQLRQDAEKEWEKLSEATVNEWKALPNQTEEEWHKLEADFEYEREHFGEQTRNFWNATEEKFGEAKRETGKKASNLRDASASKWNEITTGAAENVEHLRDQTGSTMNQLRDNMSSKVREWSSDISNILDGVTNSSSNALDQIKTKLNTEKEDGTRHRRLHAKAPYDFGYGKIVYLVGISTIFMGVIILEGVDTSIMSKSAPARLNSTFINVGLLATMVGTVGRVMGDGLITIGALFGLPMHLEYTDFVNSLFLPMIPITFLGLYLVRRYYISLI